MKKEHQNKLLRKRGSRKNIDTSRNLEISNLVAHNLGSVAEPGIREKHLSHPYTLKQNANRLIDI